MKTRQKIKKVLVVLWLAGSAGRKQMTGVLNYVRNGHPWSINLITDPAEFDADAIHKAEADGIDGIIGHVGLAAADALTQSKIPIVLIDFPPPSLIARKEAIVTLFNSFIIQHKD